MVALRRRCPPFSNVLLVQGIRLPHHRVLTRHTSSKGTLNLSSEGQLVQVIRLFIRGYEALFLEGFVVEALQPFRPFADIRHAAVAVHQGGGSGCVVGERRWASAYGREPLGIALGVDLEWLRALIYALWLWYGVNSGLAVAGVWAIPIGRNRRTYGRRGHDGPFGIERSLSSHDFYEELTLDRVKVLGSMTRSRLKRNG